MKRLKNGISIPSKKLIFIIIPIVFILLISLSIYLSYPNKNKPNFKSIINISERKKAFIDYLIPLIHQTQKEILNKREKLKTIKQAYIKNHSLSFFELRQLKSLSKDYQTDFDENNLNKTINQLLLKINTIPTGMVIAQAALESGWGTSRFAVNGNNYFGEHCFRKGCGIVPKKRDHGKINEVKLFDSPLDSVKSYFNLLNTGSKFMQFRKLRAQLEKENHTLKGTQLIKTLLHYSELKNDEYEKRLLATINYKRLDRYYKVSI